jgi:hypothetical protein
MVAKLRPIIAANPCKNNCRDVLLNRSKAKLTANMATKGAKITIHFITPVNKNAISAGDVETKKLTTMLVITAMAI